AAAHRFNAPDDRRGERVSTALLIGATGIVFASAMALAAKVFLFTSPTPVPAAPPAAVAPNTPAPSEAKSVVSQVEAEQEAEAAKQLENFKLLRERGFAKNNTSSLGILDQIVRKTRADSVVHMEAQLLKGEIEAAMVQNGGRPPAGTPAQPAATDAEEKVFQDLLTNARELAGQQRYGAAIKTLKELPAVLKMAPYPEKAEAEAAQLEQKAKAHFADLSQEADKAAADGNYARAREIYQGVQARFEIAGLAETAAARIKALGDAEEKSLQAKAAQEALKAKAEEAAAFSAQAKAAATAASGFNYAVAKDGLDKFLAKSTDAELRKLAANYQKLVTDEAWFMSRCRARLKDAIDRDPKHGSPLAGYNEKNELLFEIVDFDEKGITFVKHSGGTTGQMVREWSTINPSQHLETMKGVMDKDSAQEMLALAVMAFHHWLGAELEARTPGNDAAKTEKARAQARALSAGVDEYMKAAVQADAAARDRQAAQKAVLDKIAEMVLTAP
ncbi:MAG: hypothetical protein KIS92_16375, partial [Planctomycetota bacterium]|nr:hypothetical protein [Planctomycetota bacterium]